MNLNANKIKGLVLGVLATFCWASFYIVSRYFFGTDDDGLDPLWSSCLRYLLASLVLFITYERGVEDETLACGTGCASAGIVLNQFFGFDEKISLVCRGKDRIEIEIRKDGGLPKGVFLTGPAELAFSGELDVETPFQS